MTNTAILAGTKIAPKKEREASKKAEDVKYAFF